MRKHDRNEINNQRGYDRNDQRGLRSYLSFLSYSETCPPGPGLGVPIESDLSASRSPIQLAYASTTKTTKTTKVRISQPVGRSTESAAPSEYWSAVLAERAAHWKLGGRSRSEAERIAWAEAQLRWHAQHGERVPQDICAGCRRPIGTLPVLDLIGGSRVHLNDGNHCLIKHGERWRAAATRALNNGSAATGNGH